MLDTLRRIVQAAGAARDLNEALGIIVCRVKQAIAVDACTAYLVDGEHDEYVLMATDGLNPAAVGNVRLKQGEGLVGLVGKRREPVNLKNAADHPSYRYFQEKGEEAYHGFLGVPIVQFRRVLGVLVVQQTAERHFNDAETDFLVTITAQLAGAIGRAIAAGDAANLRDGGWAEGRFLTGVAGAPGIAIGTITALRPFADLNAVPDRRLSGREIGSECITFQGAVSAVRKKLRSIRSSMEGVLGTEELALFDAYGLLLESDGLVSNTVQRIRAGICAPGALRESVNEIAQIFEQMEDTYLRARAEDIRALGHELLVHLQPQICEQVLWPEFCILAGDEISVTQIAEVPAGRLLGIVSQRGSALSHAAILARSLGIPAVMGLGDRAIGHLGGYEVILDGYQGRVYIEPAPAVRKEYQRALREEEALSEDLAALHDLPSITPDGVRIPLYVKAGLLADIAPARISGAEGVGLYRTEFSFMARQTFPDENEQYRLYREVLRSFSPRPVMMRTLDVGGDKVLPYFPIDERNPFLGWRGIRVTLDHPEIFLTQLRAMLRANADLNNLRLLLPMVSDAAEVDEAADLLERAHYELLEEGRASSRPDIGVMIEVPSALYQMNSLARRVAFFSVGTNDLTQFLLAVDRDNSRVANLYHSLHPAVIHALVEIVRRGQQQGKPVGVCGEIAGDPAAVVLLLGMGIDNLSTTASSLPRIKWVIRSIAQHRARKLLDQACTMESASEIRRLLNRELEQAGLGKLVANPESNDVRPGMHYLRPASPP